MFKRTLHFVSSGLVAHEIVPFEIANLMCLCRLKGKWVFRSNLNVPMSKHWCMLVMLMQKLHLFADYSVTDSQAESPGDVRRQSDFSLIFLMSLKERRLLRKRDCQGRLSFHFVER